MKKSASPNTAVPGSWQFDTSPVSLSAIKAPEMPYWIFLFPKAKFHNAKKNDPGMYYVNLTTTALFFFPFHRSLKTSPRVTVKNHWSEGLKVADTQHLIRIRKNYKSMLLKAILARKYWNNDHEKKKAQNFWVTHSQFSLVSTVSNKIPSPIKCMVHRSFYLRISAVAAGISMLENEG